MAWRKSNKLKSFPFNSFSTAYFRLMKHLTLLFLLLQISSLQAKIWQVGPTRSYLVPSAVASLVADGDTVEIDAGLYTGNVAKWFANSLVIRSVGNGYAHLEAGGNYAEGKAIWVIKGNDCTVEGIEFSGCQVPDHNGAGIRQEGKNLTLRHCFFHHNEMGILTSNDGVSDFYFESCEFASNGYGDGYSHNIYVGAVHSLTMYYCYSHDSHTGHLVKSRARFNTLCYNRFTGESGDGSYEVDMPNGGLAILIGNLIEQCPTSQNGGMITLGLENQNNPEQQIILAHNTIVNDRFDGRFLQVSNATTLVKLVNNLFLGPGTLLQGTTASLDTTHNLRLTNLANAYLADPASYNYRLQPNSPAIDAGIDPGSFNNVSLSALSAYLHPLGHTARWYSGSAPDIGAYEHMTTPYRFVEDAARGANLSISPNPVSGNQVLRIEFSQALDRANKALLLNASGKIMQTAPLARGAKNCQMQLESLEAGVYILQIAGIGVEKVVVEN